MKVEFDSSFHRSLVKIKDKSLLGKVKLLIEHAEQAGGVYDIPHNKKMEGFKTLYRIRIGDYRIGLELKKDTLWFIIIGFFVKMYV
jgi:mRNA interferase RelE/StbE